MAKHGILDQQRLTDSVPARPVDSLDEELRRVHDAITQRAYELFETHGLCGQRELDDWLAAERELLWQPPASILQHDDTLDIEIAMPGVAASDVEVQVTGHEVLMKSACGPAADETREQEPVDELPRGRAFRVFRFDEALDPSAARAELRNGILKISVPVVSEPAARAVPIAV